MSTLAGLARRLSLKPYGDELLTRSADFWLFSARLIILVMATAEGIAWGYMGALMSRSQPWIAAAIAGLFVFTLVWIIDATFMTLDLSRGFYERVLLGKEESPVREKLKLAGGVAARAAIVSASLLITAPFLAQAIFAADVRDEMTRRNAGAVAAKRAEVEQPFTARLAALRREQKTLEEQRVQEAAGVGPSGKYGRGPALETIERQLAEKRSDIAAAETSRAAALARFDGLSRPQLEQQYGLRFLAPGVHASGELLGSLLKSPQFTGAERAVRAFLAFLFLGLLILKVFQPRSVAVYFNEQLHSVHDEYRKGLFDSYLPEQERVAAGGSMEPLRFEDWCLNNYSRIRGEEERRRDTAREYRIHELLIEQWQRLESVARAELEPLVKRSEAAAAATEQLEEELHRARTAAAAASAELHKAEAAHESLRQHIDRGGMDGPTFGQAMAAGSGSSGPGGWKRLHCAGPERRKESMKARILVPACLLAIVLVALPVLSDSAGKPEQPAKAAAVTAAQPVEQPTAVSTRCQRCGDGYCARSCENEFTCPADCAPRPSAATPKNDTARNGAERKPESKKP